MTTTPTVMRVHVTCPHCDKYQSVVKEATRVYCERCNALISTGGSVQVVVARVRLTWGDAADIMFKVGILLVPILILLVLIYLAVATLLFRARTM